MLISTNDLLKQFFGSNYVVAVLAFLDVRITPKAAIISQSSDHFYHSPCRPCKNPRSVMWLATLQTVCSRTAWTKSLARYEYITFWLAFNGIDGIGMLQIAAQDCVDIMMRCECGVLCSWLSNVMKSGWCIWNFQELRDIPQSGKTVYLVWVILGGKEQFVADPCPIWFDVCYVLLFTVPFLNDAVCAQHWLCDVWCMWSAGYVMFMELTSRLSNRRKTLLLMAVWNLHVQNFY